jgi:hypothetical protein
LTRRERNEAFEIDSPELKFPDEGSVLWEWFWDIRSSQNSGFNGVMRVSNIEVAYWLQITGNIVRREEAAILRTMDVRYCSEIDREAEAIREREAS